MGKRQRLLQTLCAGLWAVTATAAASVSHAAATQVVVFNNTSYPGGWGPGITSTVSLPSADVMRSFDSMSITLKLGCAGSCPPWDFVANFNACTTTDASSCTTEMGRWVTAYGAGGQWTTQADQMLALIKDGGQKTFYFWTPQAYSLSLTLTFSNNGKGRIPVAATPLFVGGDLTAAYNSQHPPISLHFSEVPLAAEIYAITTGHGWGTTAENCAEFCNIQQSFAVNGHTYTRDEPNAGTATGCANEVSIGVIAGQAGTWQYGRDGWCPGLDVKPYIVDVTSALVAGANTFSYGAFYNGQIYTPTPLASPAANGINPSIMQTSYLITWAAPNAAVGAGPQPTGNPIAGAPNAPSTTTSVPTGTSSQTGNTSSNTTAGASRGFIGDTTQTYGCAALTPDFFLWTYLGLSLGLYGRRKPGVWRPRARN